MFFRVSLADASPPVLMRVSVYTLPNLTSWPSSAGYDDKRLNKLQRKRVRIHAHEQEQRGQANSVAGDVVIKAMDAMVHNTHMV